MNEDDEIPPVDAFAEELQRMVDDGDVNMAYDDQTGQAVFWPAAAGEPAARRTGFPRRVLRLDRGGWLAKTIATVLVASLAVSAATLLSHRPSTPTAHASTAFDDPVFRELAAQADTVCQSVSRLVATCVEWDGTRDQVQAYVGPDSFTFVFSYRNLKTGRRERTVLKIFSSITVRDQWLVIARADHKHYPNLIYGNRYAYYGTNKKRIRSYTNVAIPSASTPSQPTTPRMFGRYGALIMGTNDDPAGIPKIAISASIAFGWIPEAASHGTWPPPPPSPLVRALALVARDIILGNVPPVDVGLPPDPDPDVPAPTSLPTPKGPVVAPPPPPPILLTPPGIGIPVPVPTIPQVLPSPPAPTSPAPEPSADPGSTVIPSPSPTTDGPTESPDPEESPVPVPDPDGSSGPVDIPDPVETPSMPSVRPTSPTGFTVANQSAYENLAGRFPRPHNRHCTRHVLVTLTDDVRKYLMTFF